MNFKRMLSLVLVLCMVLSFFPASAFADNDVVEEEVVEEVVEEPAAEGPSEENNENPPEAAPEEGAGETEEPASSEEEAAAPVVEEAVEEEEEEVVEEEVVAEAQTVSEEAMDDIIEPKAQAVTAETETVVKLYNSLQDALDDAADQTGIVKLVADVTENIKVEQDVKLIATGKTITGTVTVNSNVTFEMVNGTIEGSLSTSGNTTLNNVDITATTNTISVNGGVLSIPAGDNGNYGEVMNYAGSGTVKGGNFTYIRDAMIAKGYKFDAGLGKVVPKFENCEAFIGDTGYTTVDEALAVYKPNEEIVLLNNGTAGFTKVGNYIFDKNGFTLTAKVAAGHPTIYLVNEDPDPNVDGTYTYVVANYTARLEDINNTPIGGSYYYYTLQDAVEALGSVTGADHIFILKDAPALSSEDPVEISDTVMIRELVDHNVIANETLVSSDSKKLVVANDKGGNITEYKLSSVVAQIGTESFASLRDAIEAAESGAKITMVADDDVSFFTGAGITGTEIDIDKAIEIEGAGHTVTGLAEGYDTDHSIFITGKAGNVTINNLTLTGFGNDKGTDQKTNPIWTSGNYTGKLTLSNVTIEYFNRTAVNLNGGSFAIDNCVITGDSSKFQQGVTIKDATGDITNTEITGVGGASTEWIAGPVQLGLGTWPSSGSVTLGEGNLFTNVTGNPCLIVTSGASGSEAITTGTISVTGGTYNGELVIDGENGGTFAVSGGTFSTRPDESYCEDGYVPVLNKDGEYSVVTGTYIVQDFKTKLRYANFGEAVSAAEGVLVLLADVEFTVNEGVEFTADSNGHTLTTQSGVPGYYVKATRIGESADYHYQLAPYAAAIGAQYYETFAAAVDAYQSGDMITVLADTTYTYPEETEKPILIVDRNGFEVDIHASNEDPKAAGPHYYVDEIALNDAVGVDLWQYSLMQVVAYVYTPEGIGPSPTPEDYKPYNSFSDAADEVVNTDTDCAVLLDQLPKADDSIELNVGQTLTIGKAPKASAELKGKTLWDINKDANFVSVPADSAGYEAAVDALHEYTLSKGSSRQIGGNTVIDWFATHAVARLTDGTGATTYYATIGEAITEYKDNRSYYEAIDVLDNTSFKLSGTYGTWTEETPLTITVVSGQFSASSTAPTKYTVISKPVTEMPQTTGTVSYYTAANKAMLTYSVWEKVAQPDHTEDYTKEVVPDTTEYFTSLDAAVARIRELRATYSEPQYKVEEKVTMLAKDSYALQTEDTELTVDMNGFDETTITVDPGNECGYIETVVGSIHTWTIVDMFTVTLTNLYDDQGKAIDDITYKVPSGLTVSDVLGEYGNPSQIPSRTAQKKPGYTSTMWINRDTLQQVTVSTAIITADIYVEPNWTVNEYTVNYNLNGGQSREGWADSQTFVYDVPENLNSIYPEIVGAKPLVYQEGYTFTGWCKAQVPGPEDVIYENGASVEKLAESGEVSLFAQWTADTFYIAFDGNGATGGSMENMELTFASTGLKLTPNAYTKGGHEFAGWDLLGESGAVIAHYTDQQDIYSNVRATLYENRDRANVVTLTAKWNEKVAEIDGVFYDTFKEAALIAVNHDDKNVILWKQPEAVDNVTLAKGDKLYVSLGDKAFPEGTTAEGLNNVAQFVRVQPDTETKLVEGSPHEYTLSYTGGYFTSTHAVAALTDGTGATMYYYDSDAAVEKFRTNPTHYKYVEVLEAGSYTMAYDDWCGEDQALELKIPVGVTFDVIRTEGDNSYTIVGPMEVEGVSGYTVRATVVSVKFQKQMEVPTVEQGKKTWKDDGDPWTVSYVSVKNAVDDIVAETNAYVGEATDKRVLTEITLLKNAEYTMQSGEETLTIAAVVDDAKITVNPYSADYRVYPIGATGVATYTQQRVYTITYYLNDGVAPETNPTSFNPNDGTITFALATKEGYQPFEWRVGGGTAAGGTYIKELFADDLTLDVSSINTDINLQAFYTANDFTVVFDANGGTGTMADEAFVYGTEQALTANAFSRDGYTFSGWNTLPNPTEEYPGTSYADQATVSNLTAEQDGSVTLYAQWTARQYAAVFDANGGTGTMSYQVLTYDVPATLKANTFERVGYTFREWNTLATPTELEPGKSYEDEEEVTNLSTGDNVTLYAQWDANAYTVVFDANGGSGTMEKQERVYDDGGALPANTFTNGGRKFIGWALEAEATQPWCTDSWAGNVTDKTGEVTLYALWSDEYVAWIGDVPYTTFKAAAEDAVAATEEVTVKLWLMPDITSETAADIYTMAGGKLIVELAGNFTDEQKTTIVTVPGIVVANANYYYVDSAVDGNVVTFTGDRYEAIIQDGTGHVETYRAVADAVDAALKTPAWTVTLLKDNLSYEFATETTATDYDQIALKVFLNSKSPFTVTAEDETKFVTSNGDGDNKTYTVGQYKALVRVDQYKDVVNPDYTHDREFVKTETIPFTNFNDAFIYSREGADYDYDAPTSLHVETLELVEDMDKDAPITIDHEFKVRVKDNGKTVAFSPEDGYRFKEASLEPVEGIVIYEQEIAYAITYVVDPDNNTNERTSFNPETDKDPVTFDMPTNGGRWRVSKTDGDKYYATLEEGDTLDLSQLSEAITLTAQYEVKFVDSDGTSPVYHEVDDELVEIPSAYTRYNSKVGKPNPDPEKTDYIFKTWMNGTEAYDFDQKVTGPLTLKAAWTGKDVQIDFVDGSTLIKRSTQHLSDILLAPTKDEVDDSVTPRANMAYVSDELWVDADGNVVTDKTMVTEEVTVYYVNWKPVHTVNFFNGKAKVATQKIIDGYAFADYPIDEFTAQMPDITEGDVAATWHIGDVYGDVFDQDTVVDQDLDLYASFDVTVEFVSEHGVVPEAQKLSYEDKATEPEEPTDPDYNFVEWRLDGKKYDFETPVTEDIVLEAYWVAKEFVTVTFDAKGGTPNPDPQTIEAGGKVNKPDDPTWSDPSKTFDAWYELNSATPFDFSSAITADTTLEARWKDVKVTVTFDSKGGSEVPAQTFNYGGKAVKPDDPTTELVGVKFAYWSEQGHTDEFDFSTPITKDTVLEAVWEAIVPEEYTVTFDADGGTPAPEAKTVKSGDKVERPEDPTKDGMLFQGWLDGEELFDFETPITANKTLKAKWAQEIGIETQLSMQDRIGLLMWIDLAEGADPTNYTVNYEYSSKLQTIKESKPLSEFSKYQGRYWFYPVICSSSEMSDLLTVEIVRGDGSVAWTDQLSIRDIAYEKLADPSTPDDTATLILAMLQYGAYAQVQFDNHPDDLPDFTGAPALAEIPYDPYGIVNNPTGLDGYIKSMTANLDLMEAVNMIVYFTPADGYKASDFSVSVTDKNGNPVAITGPVAMSNGSFYIIINGVWSNRMCDDYNITVKHNASSAEATWTRSVMNYAYPKQSGAASVANLLQAMYQYNLAAVTVFGN